MLWPMWLSTIRKKQVVVEASAQVVYGLARTSGAEIASFRCVIDNPAAGYAKFSRGFGLTNPMDVTITVAPIDEHRTSVVYEASALGFADPCGFLTGVLDVFTGHLENHRQAWATGTAPVPAPKDKRPLYVHLGLWLYAVGILLAVLMWECR